MRSYMIKGDDAKRIREDAWLAIDSLNAILYSSDQIHTEYLKEKILAIESCLRFMRSFYE